MFEKILRIIAGLLIGIWIARYLGPEEFGLLSYAISFAGLFAVLATLGLDVILVRELVKDTSQKDVLLGTSFFLKFASAFVLLMILAVVTKFTSNDTFTNMLVYIIASASIFQSFNVIDSYFQSKVLSKYNVFANIFTLFLISIVKILLLLFEAPLISFALVIVLESIILSFGYIYFYKKQNSKLINWKFKIEKAKELLISSWPLILSGFIFTIYMKIDQIMIKELLNSESVGQYAAAVRLSESWYFIPMIIASSTFPAILNAKKDNIELYYSRLQKLYDFMVLLAIFIAIPMSFLSEWIVDFLYGEQYNQAASVLMIHIWAGLFVFLGVASGKWFLSENLQIYLIVNTAIGALINVLLNYILITEIGINGAAIATLISYSFATYFCLLFFKTTRMTFMHLSKSLLVIRLFKVKTWE